MRAATEKQIGYLKSLLEKNGMDVRFRGKSWKRLGFGMRGRSGKVDDISFTDASQAIDALKGI
jgi:hypothetical protein